MDQKHRVERKRMKGVLRRLGENEFGELKAPRMTKAQHRERLICRVMGRKMVERNILERCAEKIRLEIDQEIFGRIHSV